MTESTTLPHDAASDAAAGASSSPPLVETSVLEELMPLAPRARLLFHLQSLMSLVIVQVPFGVAVGVAVAFLVSVTWAVVGVACFLFSAFVLAVWYPAFAFDRWGYLVREEDVIIARGVLIRSVTAIPTSRIQHVDTVQGPLEQWFGLARVQIHTASGLARDGVIPGLELADAEALRDRLVNVDGDDGV